MARGRVGLPLERFSEVMFKALRLAMPLRCDRNRPNQIRRTLQTCSRPLAVRCHTRKPARLVKATRVCTFRCRWRAVHGITSRHWQADWVVSKFCSIHHRDSIRRMITLVVKQCVTKIIRMGQLLPETASVMEINEMTTNEKLR